MNIEEVVTSKLFQTSEMSPPEALIQMIAGKWVSQSIYVASSLGIADLLKDGAKHIDEIAQATGTYSPKLYRLLRALASIDVFIEIEEYKFALTPIAEYLRSDIPNSLRAFSRIEGDEWSWRSWGEILHAIKTNQSLFHRLYQVENAYEYFTKNSKSADLFNNAMTSLTRNTIIPVILDSYDFSCVEKVVDVGGGHGALIASILTSYPQISGVLYDLPHVTAEASRLLHEEGVAKRCEIVSGDFYVSIPSGGDAYILSQILHNFDDDHCIKILKNVRHAMAEKGKLLVIQAVISPGNEPCFNKFLDLALMISIDSGGQERSESRYCQLFEAAGFLLNQIVPSSAPVRVIEGVCI
ncbi:methyltransferase [Mastigocoleus testarum]|uniref:Methyltransferase n=1 Tax=Mastigocoleus testarum BC008 TaxID=371196 RepID=A0A0V7ZWA4_9CYAN|nr:methyltransferase [Mastigocoleus testarum]KST68511.1 hypothetical protein BC008_01190 [Mastigocoleus testarum BC008]KST68666.1 hypothetical protein BC008_01535 [Mastigocoleus testarum BC008]